MTRRTLSLGAVKRRLSREIHCGGRCCGVLEKHTGVKIVRGGLSYPGPPALTESVSNTTHDYFRRGHSVRYFSLTSITTREGIPSRIFPSTMQQQCRTDSSKQKVCYGIGLDSR